MPVRMEKDPENQRNQNNPRNSGGSNGLLRLLPFLLMFLFKRPKLILPVLIIGGIWYFFFGGQQYFSSAAPNEDNSGFFFGATLDQERYDKAEVFEPLATGFGNGLPARASLQQFAPQRRHQGQQGSCVGWAAAYAGHTILQAAATGQNPNSIAFSPAYLYNQIHLPNCQGAYMLDAMQAMKSNGALPFSEFGYTDQTCSNKPNSTQVRQGQQFRLKGFNRLTLNHDQYTPDVKGIKQHIAQGAPVVIGMMVGGSFMSRMLSQDVWQPNRSDYNNVRNFGGHAMCLIGYDDNKYGGSFQIMNSWGADWGNKGIAWVPYDAFEYFTREAYGLYPMGKTQQYDPKKLAIQFGLANMGTQKLIPLRKAGDISFRTSSTLNKGDKFKVLVDNSIECYVYVFGQETDGSSYVLFPYTSKHSAYCGITGTRLFPKDYSMKLDEVGNTDYIAVVVSKKELNFNQLNNRMNGSRQSSYEGKLKEALSNQRIPNVSFKTGEAIAFDASISGNRDAVGMVIAIDKQ